MHMNMLPVGNKGALNKLFKNYHNIPVLIPYITQSPFNIWGCGNAFFFLTIQSQVDLMQKNVFMQILKYLFNS